MVIISVDRWTSCCIEIGKGSIVFFFSSFCFCFLTGQRLLANWLCDEEKKKRKKSIGGVVYIDLLSPGVCRLAGRESSMDSKDNWYKMFTCFLFDFLSHQCGLVLKKAPLPPKTDINLTFQQFNFLLSVILLFLFFLFHSSSRTKTIALKICLCKRESSCYPNCWYIYIG